MAAVEDLLEAAADARRDAQAKLSLAVREARTQGWSWARISAALGGDPTGPTLQRHFADE